jgi:hypothetical protein
VSSVDKVGSPWNMHSLRGGVRKGIFEGLTRGSVPKSRRERSRGLRGDERDKGD